MIIIIMFIAFKAKLYMLLSLTSGGGQTTFQNCLASGL